MKKILVFVSSLDGKITKWENPHVRSWSSKSDQDYFTGIWNDAELIVMGRDTFTPDPVRPDSKRLLLIMTSQPSKFKSMEIPGQLEFSDESPSKIVKRFEKTRVKEMLIVGGAHVATSFLKEQLIDELWLTIEPKIFGVGSNFVVGEKLDIKLKLLDYQKANEEGTLITRYEVIKNVNLKRKVIREQKIVINHANV